jgi:hypothetical protein
MNSIGDLVHRVCNNAILAGRYLRHLILAVWLARVEAPMLAALTVAVRLRQPMGLGKNKDRLSTAEQDPVFRDRYRLKRVG